jgi:hypothetical protein
MWRKKVHKLIEAAAWTAYKQNKCKPGYRLPMWVDDLIDAMNTSNEEKAKAIFNFQYLRDY